MPDMETTVGHDAWELSRAMLRVLTKRLGDDFADEVRHELTERVKFATISEWPKYAEGVRSLAKDLSDIINPPSSGPQP